MRGKDYRQRMQRRLHVIGLVVLAALLGYLLITMPGRLIEQYDRAVDQGPLWAKVYLLAVGLGATLLIGTTGWVAWALTRNTRAARRRQRRDAKAGQQMTEAEKVQTIADHLAEAQTLARDAKQQPELRAAIDQNVGQLQRKQAERSLRIVAFGTISSGKSSVLNALAGQDVFDSDVRGGTTVTTREIEWTNSDRVTLVDTPGLGEVDDGQHGQLARRAAQQADLVLFVVDGVVKDFEFRTVVALAEMGKRILFCLNKQDWYTQEDRDALLVQIRGQLAGRVDASDVVAVRAAPASRMQTRVLSDGSQRHETVSEPADIQPLAERMLAIVQSEGKDLLIANLLLQSRGLVDDARQKVRSLLDARARKLVDRYTWQAASAAALSPIPLVDVAVGLGMTTSMVLELARIYRQPMDLDGAAKLIQQLVKNTCASLGISALSPAVSQLVASALKSVPGVGTLAGGVMQGLTQAVVTQWIGRVMIEHLGQQMSEPASAIDELARRQWDRLTSRSELINLAITGLKVFRQEKPNP